jgi:D-arabinose 1-dehydrogenase-like Zn-dependent alcohol dehydrogenase
VPLFSWKSYDRMSHFAKTRNQRTSISWLTIAKQHWRNFMAKMRAVQVPKAGGPLELVERDIPEPESGAVRIKVQACGVCHSDSVTKDGLFPGIQYPRIPGHEVIGIIDAVGANVPRWKIGQRVGVGWNGGYCGYCDSCRRGNFFACETSTLVTGLTRDGGYAEYMVAPTTAVAVVPEDLSSVEAAPLMCAGVTTFNCLRNSGARPGDVVAVIGLGGLGHLGIQFAAKSGFNTVAIGRGQDKEALARKLGASHYVDNAVQDPAAELQKLGGAKVILATVTSADAMKAVIGGLTPTGTFMIVGAVPSLEIPALQILLKSQQVKGWYSGTSLDSQETLAFSVLSGVRSMNESYPLEQASEAYDRMMSGKARFRVVLTIGK